MDNIIPIRQKKIPTETLSYIRHFWIKVERMLWPKNWSLVLFLYDKEDRIELTDCLTGVRSKLSCYRPPIHTSRLYGIVFPIYLFILLLLDSFRNDCF